MIGANEIALASGATGYAVGLGLDYLAVRRAAKGAEPLADIYDEVLSSVDKDQEELNARTKFSQNVGKYAARHLLPLSMGVAAGLNVYAWAPDNEPVKDVDPTIEVVVDHSGATAFAGADGKPAVSRIDAVVQQFVGNESFKSQAVVASSGNEVFMKVDKVSSKEPFGPADLRSAAGLALNSAGEAQKARIDTSGKPTAAILVVTNGNGLGKPSGILGESKQDIGATSVETPIFIYNVADKTDEDTEKNLKEIAKKSNAEYWDDSKKNLQDIPVQIERILANGEAEERDANEQNKLAPKVLGALALIATGAAIVSRRQRLFGRGLSGIKNKEK